MGTALSNRHQSDPPVTGGCHAVAHESIVGNWGGSMEVAGSSNEVRKAACSSSSPPVHDSSDGVTQGCCDVTTRYRGAASYSVVNAGSSTHSYGSGISRPRGRSGLRS